MLEDLGQMLEDLKLLFFVWETTLFCSFLGKLWENRSLQWYLHDSENIVGYSRYDWDSEKMAIVIHFFHGGMIIPQ